MRFWSSRIPGLCGWTQGKAQLGASLAMGGGWGRNWLKLVLPPPWGARIWTLCVGLGHSWTPWARKPCIRQLVSESLGSERFVSDMG